VISGGKFGQFQLQLLENLHAGPTELQNLHLMPTCGTQYYRYDASAKSWQREYAELIDNKDKQRIIDALNKGFDDLGYRAKKVYGPEVEDRESQITFSVLGQDIVDVLGEEGVKQKYAWDPDNSKKLAVREYVAPLIPDFEVRVGGVTSIDVTRPGIDKAYGVQKLMDMLEVGKDDVLFLGDRLQEGGNDYPVKAMGVDCLEVSRWEDTALVLEGILHVVS
ncbi:MAG TPA: HAD-IIB family hydrolase, partial [Candidatus Saccharimonadales bacterium]|nr:HAD-IIB family hydrolase [Candidatus Saccharimonadales bacterium]